MADFPLPNVSFDLSGQVANLLTEIDHIAIAVHDLSAAIDFYRDAFGATVEHREVVEIGRAHV